jgi:hypothetical protein
VVKGRPQLIILCFHQKRVRVDFPESIQKRRRPPTGLRVSPYPETALFKALPRLCISSPMPRIVAHPSKLKTTRSNAERNNVFFFILPSEAVLYGSLVSANTSLGEQPI